MKAAIAICGSDSSNVIFACPERCLSSLLIKKSLMIHKQYILTPPGNHGCAVISDTSSVPQGAESDYQLKSSYLEWILNFI